MSAIRSLLLALPLLLGGIPAQADIVIEGTRVIYPAGRPEIGVQITNLGDQPVLVQSWVDSGAASAYAPPEQISAPFTLLPPLVRVEPKKGQTLRLLYTGQLSSAGQHLSGQTPATQGLPADQESLFWFNVLEVPPKPADAGDKNYLQFAVRNRLKLFFRPQGLPGDVAKAPAQLHWHQQGDQLLVDNPTPYHISFAKVSLDGQTIDELGSQMVAPHHSLQAALHGRHGQTLAVSVINDFGGRSEFHATLNR